jgi:RNA methyltransferase, TrmH family
MTTSTRVIQSRDNPLLKRIRRLVDDAVAYRKLGCIWLEGEHLAFALRTRGLRASQAIVSESATQHELTNACSDYADELVVIPDKFFAEFSRLPASAAVGLVLPLAPEVALLRGQATVVLDRVQDAGNVGSILRSASALGFRQVIALSGTAGLWSPKVLRAAMGAHFGLHLVEGQSPRCLDQLGLPLLATSSHSTQSLLTAHWTEPCAWIFGHEGQGVAPELLARCSSTLQIPQPGGEESLNVASAAAICLYESMRRRTLTT